MLPGDPMAKKPALDKDLKKFTRLQSSTREIGRSLVPISVAGLFLVFVALMVAWLMGFGGGWAIIVGAAVIGGYMALNIGANDVANNMAPAVGSRALKIGVAVAIAAVFEAAGAIIAGGDVIATVSSGIVSPTAMGSPEAFTLAMISALFAAALWINLATWIGAPVSTTHSVVGGVLGGGIVMAGFAAADWGVVARIVASWVISPVLGGVIAAAFLAYIKFRILYVPDKLAAAQQRVPWLTGIMAGAFSAYLLMKGLSRVVEIPLWLALAAGAVVLLATRWLVRPIVDRRVRSLTQRRTSVGDLFTVPVICGAALLSFAHGANDVANAIGPLAAIYNTVTREALVAEAVVPLWILLIGGLGIAIGLSLYGPKLIRTVGSQITKLNRVRAFCVTLSAAITVILATGLGLPVSSTHIAIGSLFGVGFLREYLERKRRLGELSTGAGNGSRQGSGIDHAPLAPGSPEVVSQESPEARQQRLAQQQKKLEKQRRRYLVRRSHLVTIVSAWLITVPASALLAGAIALSLRALALPGLS